MIISTESFNRLKKEQQSILDFTVLICHSIPNVKKTIAGETKSVPHFSIPKPDYFIKSPNSRILELSQNYKSDLAKYVLISAFSFFESYIKSVTKELFDFHGGKDLFIAKVIERQKGYFNLENEDRKNSIRKLQEPLKPVKWQKYKKHLKELEDDYEYRRPSELISPLGIKYLSDMTASGNFKSVFIPDILELGYSIDLSDKVNQHAHLKDKNLKDTFDYYRELRNSISHGDKVQVSIEKAMDLVRFLRHIAVKVDKHLVEYFFILERYE